MPANPSIERTSPGTPVLVSHVKRSASRMSERSTSVFFVFFGAGARECGIRTGSRTGAAAAGEMTVGVPSAVPEAHFTAAGTVSGSAGEQAAAWILRIVAEPSSHGP
jgi:hypothetical protein